MAFLRGSGFVRCPNHGNWPNLLPHVLSYWLLTLARSQTLGGFVVLEQCFVSVVFVSSHIVVFCML